MLSVALFSVMPSVAFLYCFPWCRYAECRFAECHGAEIMTNEFFILEFKFSIAKFIFEQSRCLCNKTSLSLCTFKLVFILNKQRIKMPGKSYWGGRLSTVELLVLTCLDKLLFILKISFTFSSKLATLMRSSTVLSLPPSVSPWSSLVA